VAGEEFEPVFYRVDARPDIICCFYKKNFSYLGS